ncbi:hypothetical protein DI43_06965 [Geobacillus sp. CAMR12739]|nr:hypothetical protein DI43_06965 [Geobacillus sp. CAMR12739]
MGFLLWFERSLSGHALVYHIICLRKMAVFLRVAEAANGHTMCACPRRKEEKTDEKETRTSGGIRQQNQSIVQIKQSAVHIEKEKTKF